MIRIRRSLLFMPGNEMRKILKGAQLGPDAVIMDIEDGVAPDRKEEARQTIREALETVDFGRTERLVRINPIGSGLEVDDLRATIGGKPDGYVIPKVESADQVRWVSRWLAAAERRHGWEVGSTRLVLLIETARGVLNAAAIAAADERIDALAFGSEDYAGDVGAIRTRESLEILYARSHVVAAAAAYGRQAIGTVFIDLHDLDAFREEAQFELQLGYTGKLAIHPRQVPIIHEVFTPSPEEVERARKLLEAFEAHKAEGRGAFAYEGKMVDMPIVRAAQWVLARARED